jgi:murein DD-endopeptidase MepM/ murein hydrolase activator NlpD
MRRQLRKKYNYQPISGLQIEVGSFSSKLGNKRLFASRSGDIIDYSASRQGFARSVRPKWRKRMAISGVVLSTLMGSWYLNQSSASYAPLEDRFHFSIFKTLDFSSFATLLDRFSDSGLSAEDRFNGKTESPAMTHLPLVLPEKNTVALHLRPSTQEQLNKALPLLHLPALQATPKSAFDTPPLLDIAKEALLRRPQVASENDWLSVTIKSGDNLSSIFGTYGLSRNDLHQILNLGDIVKELRWLQPGDQIHIQRADDGGIEKLVKELDFARELHIEKTTDSESGFVSQVHERDVEMRRAHTSGQIEISLFSDGQKAGLTDLQILQLVKIFGWDIDFALDIQPGDSFSVIFEEFYFNGEKVKTGDIIAAEFVNNNSAYRAVRYTDKSGHTAYYTPEGDSMQKAFLRTPVKVGSISSHFSKNRKHPVLNKIRAHKGVDYAAPTGTPVYATSNGKVTTASWKNGYGKTIEIQHWDKYSTLYGHLSDYAKDLKVGDKVRQGQVIGYVGSTGLATGPHLHYEFHVDGVHKNPLTVALPKAMPIEAEYRADFKNKTAGLVAQLDRLNNIVAHSGSGAKLQTP